jgi:hypothetical protein
MPVADKEREKSAGFLRTYTSARKGSRGARCDGSTEHIFKNGPLGLEPDGVHIGDVVAYDSECFALRRDS